MKKKSRELRIWGLRFSSISREKKLSLIKDLRPLENNHRSVN